MDDPTFLSAGASSPNELQRWSPPPIQELDFGPNYDFDAEPDLPSWLDESASSQEENQGSITSDEQRRSVQCVAQSREPPSATPQRASVPDIQPAATTGSVAKGLCEFPRAKSSSKAAARFVPVAPKQALAKRARSPTPTNALPPGCSMFPVNSSSTTTLPTSKKTKRGTYSKKTCLRCQDQKLKCSGTIPCQNCESHWEYMNRRAQGNIRWTACIESNITELNPWTTVDCMLLHEYLPESQTELTTLLPVFTRLRNVSWYLWLVVREAAIDHGAPWLVLKEPVKQGESDKTVKTLRSISTGSIHTRYKPRMISSSVLSTSAIRQPPPFWLLISMWTQPRFMAGTVGISETDFTRLRSAIMVRLFQLLGKMISEVKREKANRDMQLSVSLLLSFLPSLLSCVWDPLRVFKDFMERNDGRTQSSKAPEPNPSVVVIRSFEHNKKISWLPPSALFSGTLWGKLNHYFLFVRYWLHKLGHKERPSADAEIELSFFAFVCGQLDLPDDPGDLCQEPLDPVGQALRVAETLQNPERRHRMTQEIRKGSLDHRFQGLDWIGVLVLCMDENKRLPGPYKGNWLFQSCSGDSGFDVPQNILYF